MFQGNRGAALPWTDVDHEDHDGSTHIPDGYLKLSLVTCPVVMMPAVTEGERPRFRMLHRATGNRVGDEDLTRGSPCGEDDHVIREDQDLDKVALDSTRTIDLHEFVPWDKSGWIWSDRPHFLSPDDAVARKAVLVILDARG